MSNYDEVRGLVRRRSPSLEAERMELAVSNTIYRHLDRFVALVYRRMPEFRFSNWVRSEPPDRICIWTATSFSYLL